MRPLLASGKLVAYNYVHLVRYNSNPGLDEENVSSPHVFFGGISVYLQQHSALFRNTPWFIDKLWDSEFALSRRAPLDPCQSKAARRAYGIDAGR
jgi:hypothetical protein